MKHILLTTIATVVLVSCKEKQNADVTPAGYVDLASPPDLGTKFSFEFMCHKISKSITGYKAMWAVADNRADGDTPTVDQLGKYFKGGMPSCPNGGVYTIGAVGGNRVTCSIHGTRREEPRREYRITD